MKKLMMLFGFAIIVLLAACSSEKSLDSLGLFGYDAESLLVGLDEGTLVEDGYAVSVYPDEVLIMTENDEFVLPMPSDTFYLSVAPYINRTHDCFYHSATGCQGELVDVDFDVLFVTSTGDVLIDETMNSRDNGFIDLWLPRDIEGSLTITYDGLSVTQDITTFDDAKTCETTMKLQ